MSARLVQYPRMAVSAARDATRFVLIDILADFVLFPVWWYTAGFVRALRAADSWFSEARAMLGVGVWARNLFTPMFAQYDIWGRLISFLVRVVNVAIRSVAVAIAGAVVALALAAYLAFPLAVLWLVVGNGLALLAA